MSDLPGICCGFCRICCFQIYQTCCCVEEPPSSPSYDVLCLGISNAGKTTLSNLLTHENTDAIVPTVGFTVKDVVLPNAKIRVKELGGAESVRQYWNRYYDDVHGVVFVIDGSCTGDELHETTEALHKAIKDPRLSQRPWLILCNKQDMDGALTEDQVAEELRLPELVRTNTNITIRSSSKANPDGLRSIMEQYGDRLREMYHPQMQDAESAPMNSI